MNKIKKYICFFLVAMTVLFSFSLPVSASENKCGDNIFWSFDTEKGELIFSGSGEMTDYDEYTAPWYVFCDDILSVTFSPEITGIGSYAFCDCESLTDVSFPSQLNYIGEGAFEMCYALKEVTIPSNVKKIEDYTFSLCSSLESVTLPESLVSIGDAAFDSCGELALINIPQNVESVGMGAFSFCTKLVNITVPSKISKIENLTFAGCTALETVELFSGVSKIGMGAFANCSSLKSVIYHGTGKQWNDFISSGNIEENNALFTGLESVEFTETEPVYTLTIVNYNSVLDVDFKSSVYLHTVEDAPEGCEIVWSNGQKGKECKVESLTSSTVLSAKLVKKNDKTTVAETNAESINVKTGFFQSVIAFFRGIFKKLPVYYDNNKIK